jgi:hypothetical protein
VLAAPSKVKLTVLNGSGIPGQAAKARLHHPVRGQRPGLQLHDIGHRVPGRRQPARREHRQGPARPRHTPPRPGSSPGHGRADPGLQLLRPQGPRTRHRAGADLPAEPRLRRRHRQRADVQPGRQGHLHAGDGSVVAGGVPVSAVTCRRQRRWRRLVGNHLLPTAVNAGPRAIGVRAADGSDEYDTAGLGRPDDRGLAHRLARGLPAANPAQADQTPAPNALGTAASAALQARPHVISAPSMESASRLDLRGSERSSEILRGGAELDIRAPVVSGRRSPKKRQQSPAGFETGRWPEASAPIGARLMHRATLVR